MAKFVQSRITFCRGGRGREQRMADNWRCFNSIAAGCYGPPVVSDRKPLATVQPVGCCALSPQAKAAVGRSGASDGRIAIGARRHGQTVRPGTTFPVKSSILPLADGMAIWGTSLTSGDTILTWTPAGTTVAVR